MPIREETAKPSDSGPLEVVSLTDEGRSAIEATMRQVEEQKLDPLAVAFDISRVQGFPLIVSTPNVCGGSARLIRTRIPVWTLERLRQLGASDSDILRSFPSLRGIDLVQAFSYAKQFMDEIETDIRENEADEE